MKTYLRRRPVAMVPLLLIHLLTWRASGANTETTFSNVQRSPNEIILEEVIISGSGNNTRIIANAVAEEPSQLSHGILSLLSKRETRGRYLTSDQDVDESQDATIVHVEDDEDDLERLKRVVARYEPQKIASRIAKRKIVDTPIDTYDTRVINGDKNTGSTTTASTTDLEDTYHEVLRNISRGISQLNNAGVTLNPYLSQAMKNLKRIPTPEATIFTVTGDKTEQPSRSNIDPSYTLSALKKKKLLLKNYMQPNHTITGSPRASLDKELRLDKSAADINESTTSKEYLHVANGNLKLKNGLSTESLLNVPRDSKKGKLGNRHKWNAENSSLQAPSSATVLQSNNHVFNADNSNKKQLKLQSASNSLHLPLKYSKVPRPFSISAIDPPQLPNVADTTKSIVSSYKRSSSSPVDVAHQVVHPAAISPLVLPTDLFSAPPARHYVPIKRTNHEFKSNGIHTAATTFANANSSGKETAVSGRPTSYPNAIGVMKIPAVAVNVRQNPGYYVITENPTERTVATSSATTYIPNEYFVPRNPQRRKEAQDAAPKTGFMPGIAYDTSNSDKSALNANPGVALYNKFASLYSIPTADVPNVLHVPQAIAQDYENFKQPSLPAQQASALPYATLRPISLKPPSSALLKPRPIVAAKPLTPYFDSSLLLPRQPGGGEFDNGKDGKENVGTNKQSRVEDADETKDDVADGKSGLGNYQAQINHETYKVRENVKPTPAAVYEIHETPSKQQWKQNRGKDLYYQRSRDDEGKYRGRQDENDGKDGRSENVREENDENDKEDVDETRDGEYVNTREDKEEDEDNDNYYQYDKFKYDRDDSEEEQRKKQHYVAEKYVDEDRPRDKHDRDTSINRELIDSSRYNDRGDNIDDEEYRRGRYEQQESTLDSRYDEKNRRGPEKEREDESVTEDELVVRRVGDQSGRGQREKYQKKLNNNGDKHKYYSHLTGPMDSLRRVQQKHEEYSETNPKHVREHQPRQNIKDHYRNKQEDNGSKDHGNEEERDHVHGETQEHAHKHEKHHDEKKHGGDHKFEAAEGEEHEKEHHEHGGEKGDKGYKVWHENEKAAKGHHDKEHSSKEYDEKDGEEKKHSEEGGYHKQHDHGEKGEKSAEFGEKGEHQKGHSTKGEHSVHKKDEYEKKTEFFDEFHEDGGTEKHGEHHHEHESEKGGHEKKAHHDGADHEEKHGKQQKYEKGGHHHEHKGHKVHEGHDHHYDHDHKYGDKGGHEHGKKWSFKKGDDGGHKHNR